MANTFQIDTGILTTSDVVTLKADDGTSLYLGQIWKEKQRNTTAVFTITRLYYLTNSRSGDRITKVVGVLTDTDGTFQSARELHSNSLRSMFPFILFDSTPKDAEANK